MDNKNSNGSVEMVSKAIEQSAGRPPVEREGLASDVLSVIMKAIAPTRKTVNTWRQRPGTSSAVWNLAAARRSAQLVIIHSLKEVHSVAGPANSDSARGIRKRAQANTDS